MDIQELAKVVPKNVTEWTNREVTNWLRYIQLPQLIPSFINADIEGYNLLTLNEEQLKKILGISSNIQRKKILNWIDFLNHNARSLHHIISTQIKNQKTLELWAEINREDSLVDPFDEIDTKYITSRRSELPSRLEQKIPRTPHRNLFVYQRFGNENQYYCCKGAKSLSIGKAANNDIFILADPKIELYHCQIVHHLGEHFLQPSPSAKSGVWVKIQKKLPLNRTYKIELGFTQIITKVKNNNFLSLAINSPHNHERQIYEYNPRDISVIRIGRGKKYQLSYIHDSTMSSLHGKFSFMNGLWYYEDILATNGSWFKVKDYIIIEDKMIFRIGRSAYIFDCRLSQSDDRSSISSVTSKGICRMCQNSEKDCYFSPCSHIVSCIDCGRQSKKCLQCNTSISSVNRFFRS